MPLTWAISDPEHHAVHLQKLSRCNQLPGEVIVDQKAKDLLQDFIDSHFRFYKKVTDDEKVGAYLLDALFDRYRSNYRSAPIR